MSATVTPRVVVRTRRPLRVSLRGRRRTLLLLTVTAAAVAAVALWSLMLGDYPVGVVDVVRILAGDDQGQASFIVRGLRAPRVAAGLLVGAELGASGAVFQGLVRNPLVAPDIIGVNAGAGTVAVAVIVTGASFVILPAAAFAGAVATAFTVYGLTWRRGITGARLVLVGIGVNAVMAALTTLMVVRFPVERVTPAVVWLTGTLYARDWAHVAGVAAGVAVLLPAALALLPRLRLLQLGDDAARALGSTGEPDRAGLLVAGAGLAGVAVAVAGPIAFVALMSPHIARMLAGPLTGGVLLLAALVGALVVLGADLIAQHAFSPVSLPVGLVTAAVGAPWFLVLLYRANRDL